MRITELQPPTNGGTLYCGRAISRRGRRYDFLTSLNGELCRTVLREQHSSLPGCGKFRVVVPPPRGLHDAIRQFIRARRRKSKQAVNPKLKAGRPAPAPRTRGGFGRLEAESVPLVRPNNEYIPRPRGGTKKADAALLQEYLGEGQTI
jgi:hypothetical protein